MENKIKRTPRDKEPELKLRGDKIAGNRYYSKDFLHKELSLV